MCLKAAFIWVFSHIVHPSSKIPLIPEAGIDICVQLAMAAEPIHCNNRLLVAMQPVN